MEDRHQSVLPSELMTKILSLLPVKPLMRFRCVNKFYNTLISDPHFIQMHLKNSARNPNLMVIARQHNFNSFDENVLNLPISLLLENSLSTVPYDPYYRLKNENPHCPWLFAGSCNGLICLCLDIDTSHGSRLCLWNPATRTKSEFDLASQECFVFAFGYDNLNGNYKVIAFDIKVKSGNARSVVKVFSMRDNCWRNIQCFPVLPLYMFVSTQNGVYFSSTVNWLALQDYFGLDYFHLNYSSITPEKYVILSLDLSTETYTQLLLPRGFNKVSRHQPKLAVLMDCLCFGHDYEETYFVIWQMKDFGVQSSWIQLFKITYQNFFSYYCDFARESKWLDFLPLCLSKNGDTLILANNQENEAFIYNRRDDRVEKIGITNKNMLWFEAWDYVESLVSTH
ncbi:F-box protein interaction domain protein [Medicago truncatula]|uniref:F-box protein interaction domain protein n=2 Tax=Medicago truncatula TaxID=3880 RepID=G7JKS4_MEDTR|nr:F-box protein interaction domain protein [Medicago truncatula]